ncbi:MAG: ATP-dependent DNA helicase RecG, partial [Oscillospiraceae bacterium]|nr:ATP-dependent DNA helicase RecG [Oscillospiraceae bacterium]
FKILKQLPISVPILGTTATANNRVVDDLKKQLGDNVYVSRGPLSRKSLSIQILHLKNKAERYAWILERINELPGSGIIYCLTQRDCDYLADFLSKNGIPVLTYYSRNQDEDFKNREAEELFKLNKIKALVATIKLGMGYDKDDIAFIIHFQQPSNIVSYYQQIGRAGRNIERAYTFLMSGEEDSSIIDYFIDTAFPRKEEAESILKLLENKNGLKIGEIEANLNFRHNRIEKALMFLKNEGYIFKDKGQYFITAKTFSYDEEHYNSVTAVRRKEKQQMTALINTKECYSKFIVNCLDDYTAEACNSCSNCLGHDIISSNIGESSLEKALNYIDNLIMDIEPRVQWPTTSLTKRKKIEYTNKTGICLSKYGDVGYGELVKRDKYSEAKRFCNELVGKSAQVLKQIIKDNAIECITCVPSLRSNIVEDFAKRLAENCGIPFKPFLKKVPSKQRQQKDMENSSHQCENALSSFEIMSEIKMPKSVILVDDIVDSRWTLTVCGYRLMENGCEAVYPFALADSSKKEE